MERECARVRLCVCVSQIKKKGDRGGSPCLYVYAFVAVRASEDKQKATDRDRDEMDEVGDVCAHAALFVGRLCRDPSGTPCACVCVCVCLLVSVHLLLALKHAWLYAYTD